ncbi:MAG: hypothetical protein AB2448_07275 [Moorella sp. (in: firmicutes)]
MSRRQTQALAKSAFKALPPALLEEKRQAVIADAVEVAPRVLKAVVEEALNGDMRAARLVLEIAGVTQRLTPAAAVQINNNIPLITPGELERLERELREVGEDV